MLTAGDEFRAFSQQGNNNAYAQDNEITWLDWGKVATRELEAFVQRWAAMRATKSPLSETLFLSKADWHDLAGHPMTTEKWNNADADGFEVRIPATDEEWLYIRLNRGTFLKFSNT